MEIAGKVDMLVELLVLAASSSAEPPKMLCAEQTAFILAGNEKLRSVNLGIHIGTAKIDTSRGELIISDGNAWAEPRSVDEELSLQSGVRMVKARSRGSSDRIAYAVYGRLDGKDWGDGISEKERVVAWIRGSALRGDQRDDSILERFRVVPFDSSKCTFHMNYGWDVILDGPKQ